MIASVSSCQCAIKPTVYNDMLLMERHTVRSFCQNSRRTCEGRRIEDAKKGHMISFVVFNSRLAFCINQTSAEVNNLGADYLWNLPRVRRGRIAWIPWVLACEVPQTRRRRIRSARTWVFAIRAPANLQCQKLTLDGAVRGSARTWVSAAPGPANLQCQKLTLDGADAIHSARTSESVGRVLRCSRC
jgi:hypothetical protein